MQLFQCQKCQNLLYFENTKCEKCGSSLGFESDRMALVALTPNGDNWVALTAQGSSKKLYRYCQNHQHDVCNWLVPADSEEDLCTACELNRFVPNLTMKDQRDAWKNIELAKHRLLYSLYRLQLPVRNKQKHPDAGMSFDFVDPAAPLPENVAATTGHADGQVTLNVQ